MGKLTIIAVLCSHITCEEELSDDQMLDQLWTKFVPEGEFMKKDQLFELLAKTEPDQDTKGEAGDKLWESMIKMVEGDAEKGLTKEQLHKAYKADSDTALKDDH